MRGLTLYPEWNWAFDVLDKRLENRGWRPPKWLLGKYLCLHAGARINGGASVYDGLCSLEAMARMAGWRTELVRTAIGTNDYELRCKKEEPDEPLVLATKTMTKSAITAVVKLIDVTFNEARPWVFHDQVHVLKRPVHCSGQRGLWRLDQAQEAQVLEQVNLS